MSVKKTVAKKAAPKKEVAKKEAKNVVATPRPKKQSKKVPSVQLVSIEMGAVIPTQQYGNFQPRVVVTAPSLEEARAVVMPFMEDLYKTYAEMPLNGKEPRFYGNVTVTEKVVDVKAPLSSEPTPEPTPAPVEPVSTPEAVSTPNGATTQRSEPFMKAQKAITLASSHDALGVIEAQIQKSVKISPSDKPELLDMVQLRRNELPF